MDEPDVFVVRIWHLASGWRASVRRAGSDDMRDFSRPDLLLAFLARAADGTTAMPRRAVQCTGDPVDGNACSGGIDSC